MGYTLLTICALTLAFVTAIAAQNLRRQSTEASKPERATTSDNQSRIHTQLQKLLAPFGVQVVPDRIITAAPAAQAVRLQWTSSPASNKSMDVKVSPLFDRNAKWHLVADETRSAPTNFPRLRSLELSPAHLLVVALDDENRVRYWTIVHDARLIRAEQADANGLLSGRVLYQDAELVLTVPFETTRVRVFKAEETSADSRLLEQANVRIK